MKRFLRSIELSLENENWHGALFTALALPDICGSVEAPGKNNNRARYVHWYDRYLLARYTRKVGAAGTLHVFLSGADCFALRCSYLHEGGGEIVDQKVRALDAFHFITPLGNGNIMHMNLIDQILQLQVDIFCKDMCAAVDQWMNTVVSGNPVLEARLNGLLHIHDSRNGVRC